MMPWEQNKSILWVHGAQGPKITASNFQNMYVWLGFSLKAARLLVREQGLDNPHRLRVFTNKNDDDICNVVRKPGGKNADGTQDRGQQVSMIAQENLKLTAFLFHHQWRCTLDWEIMGVDKETVHFLVGQKKLEAEYKDPDVLTRINKSDMAGMMESIKEYLRSCHGVIKRPLAYIIRKAITVQTYGNHPTYSTSDDKMIARMLHLPPDKNKLLLERDAHRVQDHTAEYVIDNRMVYDILDQICKDTDLYPYVKQHKSKRDGRGAFYAIHSRWLGLNHVNATASEAEMALQMSMYDGEKRAWNWEKYVAHHVKYHIILMNLMEYGYQGLNQGSKV